MHGISGLTKGESIEILRYAGSLQDELLATRRLTQFSPTDLGQAARVAAVQRLARSSGK